MTADEVVKDVGRSLGRSLRDRRYQGTSPNWRLADDEGNLVLVNLQRSQSSTAATVRFTVNVSVVNRRLWVWEYEDLADRRKPDVWSGHWKARPAGDHWWAVSGDSDPDRLATDVVSSLEPLLSQAEELLADDALRFFWETGQGGGLLPGQVEEYRRVLAVDRS